MFYAYLVCFLLIISSVNSFLRVTQIERSKLKQFRSIVEKDLYKPQFKEDLFLLKWLRGSSLNVDRAVRRLRTSLKWRRENGIDGVLDEDTSKIQKAFPVYDGGKDKENRPVLILPIGSWNIRKAILTGNEQLLLRHFYKVVEEQVQRIHQLKLNSTNSDEIVEDMILIVDLNGFSTRIHACLRCIPLLTRMLVSLDSNYPLYTKEAFLINTPRAFEGVLKLVENILMNSGRKQTHLIVYGVNKLEWEQALLEHISSDQLPTRYGGTKT